MSFIQEIQTWRFKRVVIKGLVFGGGELIFGIGGLVFGDVILAFGSVYNLQLIFKAFSVSGIRF